MQFADRWTLTQRRILSSKKQFIFLFGGNGAGKTALGGYWVAQKAMRYSPITRQVEKTRPGERRLHWVVGPSFDKVNDLMIPSIKRFLPEGEIARVERSAKESQTWHLKNGDRVCTKSYSQDIQDFQGSEVDSVWCDEEVSNQEVWKEILSRTFRRNGQVLSTNTASMGLDWMHAWVFSNDAYPMEHKEIVKLPTPYNPYYYDCDNCAKPRKWHYLKIHGACNNFDNSMGRTKLERLKRQWHGIDYQIRVLGEFLLATGTQVITNEVRRRHEEQYQCDPIIGHVVNKRFIELRANEMDNRAWLRLAVDKKTKKPLLPVAGHEYVIGVDVASGNGTGDWHAAAVVDQTTGDQVALAHSRVLAPSRLAECVAELAKFYNEAFVVVEGNQFGTAVIERLWQVGYFNLYTRTSTDAVQKKPGALLGFWTNSKSKWFAVELMRFFVANRMKIRDPTILAEMYHYTILKNPKTGSCGIGSSNDDAHDDTMTALFCASVGLHERGWGAMESTEMLAEKPVTSVEVDETRLREDNFVPVDAVQDEPISIDWEAQEEMGFGLI